MHYCNNKRNFRSPVIYRSFLFFFSHRLTQFFFLCVCLQFVDYRNICDIIFCKYSTKRRRRREEKSEKKNYVNLLISIFNTKKIKPN